MAQGIVNPGGEYKTNENGLYPKEVNFQFENMLRVLIVSWSICILIGVMFVFKAPVHKEKSNHMPRLSHSPYGTHTADELAHLQVDTDDSNQLLTGIQSNGSSTETE